MLKTKKSTGHKNKFIVALIAAGGSFIVGIFQPMDMWAARQNHEKNDNRAQEFPTVIKESRAAIEPAKVNDKELEKVIKIKPAVATRVKGSENALQTLELKRFNFGIPKRFQGTIVEDLKLSSNDKVIALTFDDGPWPKTTDLVLDILKKNQIKATFFVVGQHLESRPELANKIVDDGHVIANHTWNHPTYKMGKDRVQSEIGRTAELIYEITGRTTTLFRPPGGVIDNGLADFAKSRRHVVVLWTADSVDWLYKSPQKITENVLRKASNGGIVLLHDGGGPRMHVVRALPNIIAGLKKQGYRFVTVPELLEIKDKQLHQQELAQKEKQNQQAESRKP